MTVREWKEYFHSLPRKRVLNILSLEVSRTKLGSLIQRPDIVRQLDWIDFVWPKEKLKKNQYPQVQLYCLLSAKGSWTDFHIDFGGSSVFYHIVKGRKIFYVIEPTPEAIEIYEKWYLTPKADKVFLGDLIECRVVELKANNTFLIPSGWIHAVYTPEDSLVIGGNFLNSLCIKQQIEIHELEQRTNVPIHFMFPMFDDICIYVIDYYSKSWSFFYL